MCCWAPRQRHVEGQVIASLPHIVAQEVVRYAVGVTCITGDPDRFGIDIRPLVRKDASGLVIDALEPAAGVRTIRLEASLREGGTGVVVSGRLIRGYQYRIPPSYVHVDTTAGD
jgi:hypothetical protein